MRHWPNAFLGKDLGMVCYCSHVRSKQHFHPGMLILPSLFATSAHKSQGLHVLTSAKYLNTITNHSQCTIVFAVIATLICWVSSLPRTFSALSKLGTASAFFTFISVLLAAIFAGIEDHPYEYNPDPNSIIKLTGLNGGAPTVFAIPPKGTTFVAGMSAFLNISYTFIGQITLPSFIAEMRNPRDFPKALWVVTVCEIILFSCVGAVVYACE